MLSTENHNADLSCNELKESRVKNLVSEADSKVKEVNSKYVSIQYFSIVLDRWFSTRKLNKVC